MNRLALIVFSTVTAAHAAVGQSLEALWYSTPSERSTQDFLAHADQISVVSPQVFSFTRDGSIRGRVDPRIIEKAKEKGVKVIPLVMNPGFDQAMMHHILTTSAARLKAIRSMTALCRDQHFAGIQFDIENVHIRDKEAFTTFSRMTADSLHAVGCTLSAAVVPRISEEPGPTSYHRWIFDNWRGVYDYKALADVMDFLSYMTYAQHTGGSTPGPVAGYTWVKESLDHLIAAGVPPSKISLGLAAYSDYWYPVYDSAKGPRMRGHDISYRGVMDTLAKRKLTATWDDREKAQRAEWSEAGVYEYAWIEDARAFMAKLELVKQYKLRGYSVWVLGLEDPKTWESLRTDRPERR
ncbi:MAG TPA: glycosyl hydrolase family 18 protein [Gemmatimonadaceae bacterium]